ncbi:hypothetical protein V1264_017263 [Littorina saxatilis]|uniref:Immunoglobulin subtype domain-containing protein n=1 Tax=Littorina saxatilis TaxID=31220 RepID=A0AAN9BIU6_9CAEN
MIGMKFTGQLLLFLCCYYLTSAAKETITCDAPSVRDGQPASVTCDFKRDVSALSSATVTVEHYPDGSPDPIPVLECTPVGADCTFPVQGYEFNGQINTKLVLTITRASKANNGRYACKMLSPYLPDADEVDPCDFTLDGKIQGIKLNCKANKLAF